MIFRKTLLVIISSATYCKIIPFIGAMFFQNVIFMQHEFFILEYTFICLSSNFYFFLMEHILYNEKWDDKM